MRLYSGISEDSAINNLAFIKENSEWSSPLITLYHIGKLLKIVEIQFIGIGDTIWKRFWENGRFSGSTGPEVGVGIQQANKHCYNEILCIANGNSATWNEMKEVHKHTRIQ